VLAARYAHLAGRADKRLTKTQACVPVAASLLRQLQAVLTTGTHRDPASARGGIDLPVKGPAAAACTSLDVDRTGQARMCAQITRVVRRTLNVTSSAWPDRPRSVLAHIAAMPGGSSSR
jgi:hypothetical protein